MSSFGKRYAGFWMRFLAYFIDQVLIGIASLFVFFPLGFAIGLLSQDSPELSIILNLVLQAFSLVATWLFYAYFESSKFQASPGKLALGLMVTDLNGQRIGFGKATGRFFGRIVSGLILLIGYIMQPFTEKKQALHDIMAGTLVVHKN